MKNTVLLFFVFQIEETRLWLVAAGKSNEFDYSNLREAKYHIATKRSFDEISSS